MGRGNHHQRQGVCVHPTHTHEPETQNNRHTETPIFRIYEEQEIEPGRGRERLDYERLDYERAEDHYCDGCKAILANTDYDYDQLPDVFSEDCDFRYSDGATRRFDRELLPAAVSSARRAHSGVTS